MAGRTIFAQLLDYSPKREFQRIVTRHKGDKNVRSFSCRDQFLCMVFAQLTNRESLRDIEVCLRGMKEKLYLLGLRGKISKSTLADANDKRSSQIFADYCKVLIKRAQKLYADEPLFSELIKFAFAIDSSWISLCLSLSPWARFGSEERAFVKLHTVLDLRGSLPVFITISKGNINDFQILDDIDFIPGAFYVMDKGYFDLGRLNKIDRARAHFVTRKKKGVHVNYISDSGVPIESAVVKSDSIVEFRRHHARGKYPNQLRLIKYYAHEIDKHFVFITNNFTLPAVVIAELYKRRWDIELFFRWVKQHLRVTRFYGTSLNAIETQIWIATSTYLLVAIAKKELKVKAPLSKILQLLSVSLFEEKPVLQAFGEAQEHLLDTNPSNQLKLF